MIRNIWFRNKGYLISVTVLLDMGIYKFTKVPIVVRNNLTKK